MSRDFYFWFSIISLLINVVLILISVGLFVANRKEKERRNSQVKIWMQSSNGITQALERIISDKWRNYYSTVQDMANTIHAVHASSFALYQSLYEERAITEEEYKKEQAEIRKSTRNLDKNQQVLALPTEDSGSTPLKS